MDDKVYTQEVIQDNPFPGEPLLVPVGSQANPAGTYSPTTTKSKEFPRKRVAVELLSTALNTRSRKILEAFELQQSGGLQIGNFQEGIAGDLRITPRGITARDIAGLTTFVLDADTGDVTMRGELRSGSVVTGQLIMGPDGYISIGDESGATVLDSIGLVSQNNFNTYNDSFEGDISFSSTSYADIAGLQIDLPLQRPTRFLVFVVVEVANEQTNGTLDMLGRVEFRINIAAGERPSPPIIIDTGYVQSIPERENVIRKTYNLVTAIDLDKENYGSVELLPYPVTIPVTVSYKHLSNTNLTTHIYSCYLLAVALGS